MLRPRMSSIVESGLTAVLSFDLDGEIHMLILIYIKSIGGIEMRVSRVYAGRLDSSWVDIHASSLPGYLRNSKTSERQHHHRI
jgi:hypothetical protein